MRGAACQNRTAGRRCRHKHIQQQQQLPACIRLPPLHLRPNPSSSSSSSSRQAVHATSPLALPTHPQRTEATMWTEVMAVSSCSSLRHARIGFSRGSMPPYGTGGDQRQGGGAGCGSQQWVGGSSPPVPDQRPALPAAFARTAAGRLPAVQQTPAHHLGKCTGRRPAGTRSVRGCC